MLTLVCMAMMLLPEDCATKVFLIGTESICDANDITEHEWTEQVWKSVGDATYQDGYRPTGTKDVITRRIRTTTLTFYWLGRERTITDSKVLWREVQTFKKQETWVPITKPERTGLEDMISEHMLFTTLPEAYPIQCYR